MIVKYASQHALPWDLSAFETRLHRYFSLYNNPVIHHAYLIVGPKSIAVPHALSLHDVSIEESQNDPDIQILGYEVFGIDDARNLGVSAIQRPIGRSRRIFIISAESITNETQNALLKLFEDPPRTSAFVLISADDAQILPTLRSRFEVIRLTDTEGDMSLLGKEFLKLSPAKRIEEIAVRTKAKDSAWGAELLSALERELHERRAMKELRDVLFVALYMKQRGASPKMLLEHLALSIE